MSPPALPPPPLPSPSLPPLPPPHPPSSEEWRLVCCPVHVLTLPINHLKSYFSRSLSRDHKCILFCSMTVSYIHHNLYQPVTVAFSECRMLYFLSVVYSTGTCHVHSMSHQHLNVVEINHCVV